MSAQRLSPSTQRPADAAGVIAIWPGDGVPPDSEDWTWHEQTMQAPFSETPAQMVRNVVVPTLTVFGPPERRANGTAVIVAPGGAFHFLMMDHEGYDVARRLSLRGVTAFVLAYRLQHTPEDDADMPGFLERLFENLPRVVQTEVDPPMTYPPSEQGRLWGEEDGRQAIRYVRAHAPEWGVDPGRIGIMGFSAGGGIAVNAALEHDQLSRPDFAAGIYPGYRLGPPVPRDAPPLFLATADDDRHVAPISTARLYEAWHKAGAPVELHIFASGGHGFGMRTQDLPSDGWMELFERWLDARGLLSAAAM